MWRKIERNNGRDGEQTRIGGSLGNIKFQTHDPQNTENIFSARYLMWYVLFHPSNTIILSPENICVENAVLY